MEISRRSLGMRRCLFGLMLLTCRVKAHNDGYLDPQQDSGQQSTATPSGKSGSQKDQKQPSATASDTRSATPAKTVRKKPSPSKVYPIDFTKPAGVATLYHYESRPPDPEVAIFEAQRSRIDQQLALTKSLSDELTKRERDLHESAADASKIPERLADEIEELQHTIAEIETRQDLLKRDPDVGKTAPVLETLDKALTTYRQALAASRKLQSELYKSAAETTNSARAYDDRIRYLKSNTKSLESAREALDLTIALREVEWERSSWIALTPEPTSLRKMGPSLLAVGTFTKEIVVNGQHSPRILLRSDRILLHTTTAGIKRYQMVRLHEGSGQRELHIKTIRDATPASRRDRVPFKAQKVGDGLYEITIPQLEPGEYGLLTPFTTEIYTFRISN